MHILSERIKFVEDFAAAVMQQFPQVEKYNILIFGSFLTERYTEDSDIDVGIFSLSSALSFRLYVFTKDYFEQRNIASDVIRMRLLESQFINIAIIKGQKYAVTDYCPEVLIEYTKRMIDVYGDNPQETIVRKLREEAVV